VKGVSRGQLCGLSEDAIIPGSWGIALVNEFPELTLDDFSEDMSRADFVTASSELMRVVRGLDLSEPGSTFSSSQDSLTAIAATVHDLEVGESPQLWTHERPSPDEALGRGMGDDEWMKMLKSVTRQLTGVSLRVKGAQLSDEAYNAVAIFYAVLGQSAFETRREMFELPGDIGLGQRLRLLADVLRERQGMAQARRSLAAVFATDDECNRSNTGTKQGGNATESDSSSFGTGGDNCDNEPRR